MARRGNRENTFPHPLLPEPPPLFSPPSIDRFLIEKSLARPWMGEHPHHLHKYLENKYRTKRNETRCIDINSFRYEYKIRSSDLSEGGAETVNFVGRVGNEKLIGCRASATKAIATRHTEKK